ncbi:MAG TPA: anthranilate synthase component I family protein [Caldithrix abyssi]|uniref:Anthranilate synthase component I family protein n=1 Tax=Caldithrix abyssi TaxID=187145 RepID=A0A7V4WWM7_CALAY|nr:anthranilate synthase component I family protein [Caldithrix abyssi]
MIHTFLKAYFNEFRYDALPYSRYKAVKKEWLAEEPVLHIPRWPYVRRHKTELIVKTFSAVLFGKLGKNRMRTSAGEFDLEDGDVFDLMKVVESAKKGHIPYFGFLAYDAHPWSEPQYRQSDFYGLPDFYLLFPAEILIIDHHSGEMRIGNAPQRKMEMAEEKKAGLSCGAVEFHEDREQYLTKIKKIRNLIAAGEVYQINYTTRLSASCGGDGYTFFKTLDKHNPAPFAVYARLPHCRIISNSPERFVLLNDGTVLTEPIKGTIQRYDDPEQDAGAKNILRNSEKDAAELSMIVDLLRNDLSKVCNAGSVLVESHRRLETFRNVHHLVSTITGKLQKGKTAVDLLRAVFPGGSISGCPKVAALRYIRNLEEHNRSFYTGSFFISNLADGTFDSSILIRTGILKDGRIHFQVGGGIVTDSDPAAEYQECLAKAASFIRTVEALRG